MMTRNSMTKKEAVALRALLSKLWVDNNYDENRPHFEAVEYLILESYPEYFDEEIHSAGGQRKVAHTKYGRDKEETNGNS